jgi:hypothetical protein
MALSQTNEGRHEICKKNNNTTGHSLPMVYIIFTSVFIIECNFIIELSYGFVDESMNKDE